MNARLLLMVLATATITVLSTGLGTLQAHPSPAASVSPSGTGAGPARGPLTAPVGPAPAARLAEVQHILAEAKARHIPLPAVSLPNLLGQASITKGIVSPLSTVAPAPMGIGTYGVLNKTGTPSAYQILTRSWEGSITLNSVNTFWLDNDGVLTSTGTQNTFGVQLNAITLNTTVNHFSNNSFWAQNVVYWNLIPGEITFLDNIWNFSSPGVSLTNNTIFSGNGTPVYPTFYYDFDISGSIAVTLPVTVHLYLNSSVTNNTSTGHGYTTLRFGYDVVNATSGLSEAHGVYDTVEFNSSRAIGTVPLSPFDVDGTHVTPTGFLPYDAEIMIGGPGGGTTTSIYGINGSEQLQYWNGTAGAYQNPPSAWNVGSDTGETSEGIAETYTTPGTVQLSAGPSIPMPFWNATPGGNEGSGTIGGALSPSNAFIFVTPGSSFSTSLAAWAPTQTAPSASYSLPPGNYTVSEMLSDYKPITAHVTVTNGGHAPVGLVMTRDTAKGVYTPLDAWNNAQLATISSSGSGTPSIPYTLDHNGAKGGLNPVFSEMNDYLYPVFPAVLLAGTTDHVTITGHASVFNVSFAPIYLGALAHYGLPSTNQLQIQLFDTANVTIFHLQKITGWFFFLDYGPSGFLPLANVVIFQGTHNLVDGSTFTSQGSSLLLADINASLPTNNYVWGNRFVTGAMVPAMYPGDGTHVGPAVSVFAFESGDHIYNNKLTTAIPAYAPNANFFSGAPQLNLENWNVTGGVEPKSFKVVFNGEPLKGAIVGSAAQGGNFWSDYLNTSGLPFNNTGFIASGGDPFPLPIFTVTFTLRETGPAVTWWVMFNGFNTSTTQHFITFYASSGNYAFSDGVSLGSGTITPKSGSVGVNGHNVHVPLTHT